MSEEGKKEEGQGLGKEEKAFLIKSLWKALCAPKWAKNDLIDFGLAINKKTTLKDMDDGLYIRLAPYLSEIADGLGAALHDEANRAINAELEKDATEAKRETEGDGEKKAPLVEKKVAAEGSREGEKNS